MSDYVTIAMLLRPEFRDSQHVAEVVKLASDMGLVSTGSGAATVSFRATPEQFEQLFGTEAKPVSRRAPSDEDFGAPEGYSTDIEPTVPDPLKALVQSVSIIPPAKRL